MNRTLSDSIEDLSGTLTHVELVLIGAIMIIICAVTVIGNALVMLSFLLDKKLRTLSNYFLLSLATSDIMTGAFSMPLFTVYLLIGEWTLGPTVCNMWLSQDYTCGNATCFNLLMIAVDRYFSVTDPLRYRTKRTPKRVGIMIGSVWIISFLLWPPWIYAWPYIEGRRTVPEDDCYIQFLETNTLVTIITASINYYVPVIIILALYYKIWRATKKRNRYLADVETGYQSESECLRLQNLSCEKKEKEPSSKLIQASCSRSNTDLDNPKADNEIERDAATALLTETADSGLETTGESKTDNKNTDLKTSIKDLTFSDQLVQSNISTTQKGGIKRDKAARVLTVILLAFLMTTIPYSIVVIIKNLDSTYSIVPDSVWSFVYYLFYVSSTLNPLCYALANENFRKTYWRILTCSWSRKSRGTHSNKPSESKTGFNSKHVTSFL